jgi:hypothetical protein
LENLDNFRRADALRARDRPRSVEKQRAGATSTSSPAFFGKWRFILPSAFETSGSTGGSQVLHWQNKQFQSHQTLLIGARTF